MLNESTISNQSKNSSLERNSGSEILPSGKPSPEEDERVDNSVLINDLNPSPTVINIDDDDEKSGDNEKKSSNDANSGIAAINSIHLRNDQNGRLHSKSVITFQPSRKFLFDDENAVESSNFGSKRKISSQSKKKKAVDGQVGFWSSFSWKLKKY